MSRKKLQIVADENMPHIDALFAEFAEIKTFPGRAIGRQHLAQADALLCRSVTQVGAPILADSSVKFVGTATIGTDHLDLNYLQQANIDWANAAGCNAAAVAQYVISGMAYWLKQHTTKNLSQICVGIIGAGNVGSELARCLTSLGVEYKLCDPPLARQGDPRAFVSLDDSLVCDVISIHVPLTQEGPDKTASMIDSSVLKNLSSQQLLINAARGPVVNNRDLLECLTARGQAAPGVILDVFENEPEINFTLAQQCLLATPHIAGHTLEGKSRGSYMIYQAFCQAFDLPISQRFESLLPSKNQLPDASGNILDSLLALYSIKADNDEMQPFLNPSIGLHFDRLRKSYNQKSGAQPRRDYSGWQTLSHKATEIARLIG